MEDKKWSSKQKYEFAKKHAKKQDRDEVDEDDFVDEDSLEDESVGDCDDECQQRKDFNAEMLGYNLWDPPNANVPELVHPRFVARAEMLNDCSKTSQKLKLNEIESKLTSAMQSNNAEVKLSKVNQHAKSRLPDTIDATDKMKAMQNIDQLNTAEIFNHNAPKNRSIMQVANNEEVIKNSNQSIEDAIAMRAETSKIDANEKFENKSKDFE